MWCIWLCICSSFPSLSLISSFNSTSVIPNWDWGHKQRFVPVINGDRNTLRFVSVVYGDTNTLRFVSIYGDTNTLQFVSVVYGDTNKPLTTLWNFLSLQFLCVKLIPHKKKTELILVTEVPVPFWCATLSWQERRCVPGDLPSPRRCCRHTIGRFDRRTPDLWGGQDTEADWDRSQLDRSGCTCHYITLKGPITNSL